MIRRFWLTAVLNRLLAPTKTKARRRSNVQSVFASQVEFLEQRQLLTNLVALPAANIGESISVYPYPNNSIAVGTVIEGISVATTGTDVYFKGNLQIIGGNTDVNTNNVNPFAINGNDQIYVNDPGDLYYDVTRSFTLTVQATYLSGGTTAATTTLTYTINLIPQNGLPVIPQYAPGAYIGDLGNGYSHQYFNPLTDSYVPNDVNVLQINAGSGNGTVVGNVSAYQDQNRVLTYAFEGLIPGVNASTPAFSIDPFSGQITVKDAGFLNYQQRRLQNLNQGNLGEPGYQGSSGLQGYNEVVFRVRVRATESSQTSYYSQTNSGSIGTTNLVNDSWVYIRLRDTSVAPPDVSKSTQNLSVPENASAGTQVGYFDLVDGTPNFIPGPPAKPATGLNPAATEQTFSFAITGGNSYKNPNTGITYNNVFSIDYTTGALTLNAANLDYGAFKQFKLQIQVTNQNTYGPTYGDVLMVNPQSSFATLAVNVTEFAKPTSIPAGQNFTIPEASVNGTFVGVVLANDPNLEKPNGTGILNFSIISGNSVVLNGVTYTGIFAINASTGTITVNNTTNQLNKDVLNYINQATFHLIVQAEDVAFGTLSPTTASSSTVTVALSKVNTIPPTVNNGSATIPESSPAGTLVGQVVASTPDNSTTIISYQIIAVNGVLTSITPNTTFAIDNTGKITVNDPTLLVYLTTPVWALSVQATESGTPALTGIGTFTVSLSPINHPISMNNQTFKVTENSSVGTLVGTIVTTDADFPPPAKQVGRTFTINAGNTGGTFAIDNATGNITVAAEPLMNWSTNPQFNLLVTVTDGGVPPTSAQATITINLIHTNNYPVILPQTFSVAEHSVAGTVVGQVLANDDRDPGQVLAYSITAGNTNNAFSIDPTNGYLTVNDPHLIDYNTNPQFNLTVQVINNGVPPLSSSAIATVNLTQLANRPVITPISPISIPEFSPNGTVVVPSIPVTGDALTLTYSITSGNSAGAFAIDATTGKITVKNSALLDNVLIPSFTLGIMVIDNQIPAAADTGTISITLTNIDRPPALFGLESTTLTYAYQTAPPTPVTSTIVATSPVSNFATQATVQITTNYQPGEDFLYYSNPSNPNITGTFDPVSGTLTLSGTDTFTNYRAAIRAVTYQDTSSTPIPLVRTLSFTVTDDGARSSSPLTSSPVTRKLQITGGPVLSSPSNTLAYTEQSGAQPINPTITAFDVDSPTLTKATITLSSFVSTEDVLGFSPDPSTMGNIALTSNVNGVMTLTSAGGTATLAQWQTALQAITYTNTSFTPTLTPRTVSMVVDDGTGSNNLSSPFATTININKIDFPPVLSNPSTITFTEGNPPTVINSLITVSDIDKTTEVSATITINNYVAGQDQLGFTNNGTTMGNISVQSNSKGVLQLVSAGGTATLTQWQNALQAVTYNNTSLNPVTTARKVSFVMFDGTLNSNVLVSTINVVAVNNPPVLSNIETTPLQYIQNPPSNLSMKNTTPITQTITVSSPDTLNMTSATIQITPATYQLGEDFLRFTNTSTITGSWNATTGTMTLTGTDTLANYTAALRSVAYFNYRDMPVLTPRTVTYVVTDDGGPTGIKASSNTVSRMIDIVHNNEPPVLTNPDTTVLNYTEDAAGVIVLPNVAVTDPDSNNLMGATITISANYNDKTSTDVLAFTNTSKITGSWDPVKGVLTLSGVDSVSNYRTALRTVTFANHNDPTTTPNRTVSYVVTDDQGLSGNTVSRNISITTHPKASVLSGIETTAAVFKANDPYTPPAPVTSTLVVSDFDSLNLTSATITISNNYIRNEDSLVIDPAVASADKVTAAWNATTGQLTLTGLSSLANYQNALRSVKYVDSSSTPNTATRTVSFQVFDDTAGSPLPSNVVSRSVIISTTNVAPSISTNTTTALQYVEKDPATIIAPALTITDPDSPNMNGATIKITSNYAFPQDQLIFTNTATIKGSFDSTSGTLTLSGLDTQANYQTALRSVQYLNTSNNPSGLARTVSFSVTDGLAYSNITNRVITVTPVNDPPTVAINQGDLTYSASTSAVVAIAPGFTVTDPDSNFATTAKIQIVGGYERGKDVLAFVNTATITGTFDVASGTLTLTGTDTFSNYRAAIRSITYQYSGSAINSTKTVSFSVSDGIAFSNIANRQIDMTS